MPLKYLPMESDDWIMGCLALYRRLDRQARAFGWALDPASRDLLAQYEAEAARRGLGAL